MEVDNYDSDDYHFTMIWHVPISRKFKKNDYKTNFLEVQIDVLDISIGNIFSWRKEYRNELSMFKTMLGWVRKFIFI